MGDNTTEPGDIDAVADAPAIAPGQVTGDPIPGPHRARRSWWIRAAVVLVLILPTAAAAVYMWIMWDPEPYLKRVPVAVANLDTGAQSDGKQQNLGSEILDSLTSAGELDFHQVSAQEAINGLREARYAFSIVIPRDFTKRVLSVTDATPTPAQINVYYNDSGGTLGSTVASSVVTAAQMEISKTIGTTYAGEVLVGLNQLGSGLHEAADGSGRLHDGTVELADGAAELSSGLGEAHAGTRQLKDGTAQVAEGMTQLHAGTAELGDGAVQIRDGVAGIADPLLGLIAEIHSMGKELGPVIATLSVSPDPTLREAGQSLSSLLGEIDATNANGTAGQLTQLRDGTAEIARQLTDPTADYLNGVNQLVTGTGELDAGAAELLTGMGQLDDGGKQLAAGTIELRDGAAQLNTGLSDGAGQAPTIADVDSSASMFGAPVTMDVTNQEPAQEIIDGDRTQKAIGRGAAPLIIVLVTFLLAILSWLVMPAVRGSAVYASRWARAILPAVRGAVPGMVVGVAVALLSAMLGASLGWDPANWAAMALVAALIGATAALVSQAVVLIFGRVYGTLITFALYMYGIFAFGGVFPMGTTPPLFRPFEPISPMTYALRAVLRAYLGLYDQMFWVSLLMLVLMGVLATGVAVLYRYRRDVTTVRGTVPPATHDDALMTV